MYVPNRDIIMAACVVTLHVFLAPQVCTNQARKYRDDIREGHYICIALQVMTNYFLTI